MNKSEKLTINSKSINDLLRIETHKSKLFCTNRQTECFDEKKMLLERPHDAFHCADSLEVKAFIERRARKARV